AGRLAELAGGARSPAAQLLVGPERAGVGTARGDADRCQRRRDARRFGRVGRREVTELAAAVGAPAEQRARAAGVVGGGAVVRAARGQRADVGQAGNGRGGRAQRVAADRELAIVVVAPAVERAVL